MFYALSCRHQQSAGGTGSCTYYTLFAPASEKSRMFLSLGKKAYLCSVVEKSNSFMTQKEAMARFMAAKEKKRQCVEQLEEKMKKAYEQRTGKPANYTFVL